MSKNKLLNLKTLILILTILLIILPVFSLIFSHIDFSRVNTGKEPLFCFLSTQLKDGGTVRWTGLGYSLSAKHSLINLDGVRGYKTGPALEFWIPVWPFVNKKNLRFEKQ